MKNILGFQKLFTSFPTCFEALEVPSDWNRIVLSAGESKLLALNLIIQYVYSFNSLGKFPFLIST